MLKRLGTAIPLVSILIIILGVLKQLLYYANFNLPIKYFIGLTELGLLISDDLMIYVPFLLLIMFLMDLERFRNEKKEKKENSKPNKITTFHITYIILPASSIIFFLIYLYLKSFPILLTFIGFSTVSVVYIVLFKMMDLDYNIEIKNNLLLIFFCLLLYYSMFCSTAFELINVEDEGKYNGTLIRTADKEYISTDSSFFIGKTEKYVFVYDKKDKSTDIIPTESIKYFKLKSK